MTRQRLVGIVLLMVTAGVLAAALDDRTPSSQSGFDLRVKPVESPARGVSAQPQLSVSSRGILLSWIERSENLASLRFAERTLTGWSPPQTVASGNDWFVNWADVPSVVRLTDGTLVAHWLQKSGPGTYAYDVRLSSSKDDGRTWSASFLPHHDGTKTEHGFASLFELPGQGLGLVWLDGRAMQSEGGHDTTPGVGGAMTLRFGSFDRTWKQTADMAVDLRVCECCPTTAVMTVDGPLVAFRNRSDDEVRDIYVARFENGKWTEPKPVSNDGWRITGCPVNGPMLAARGREVVVAWFTARDSQPRAFVAFSRDAGRTFGPPIRVDDDGTLGRVDVEMLNDSSALVSWIARSPGVAQFQMRRVEPSGSKSNAIGIATLASDRTSGYPRIARQGDELVMAWVENAPGAAAATQPRVRTAVAKLPPSGR